MSQWRMKLIMKCLRAAAQNTEGKVFSDSQISYIVCARLPDNHQINRDLEISHFQNSFLCIQKHESKILSMISPSKNIQIYNFYIMTVMCKILYFSTQIAIKCSIKTRQKFFQRQFCSLFNVCTRHHANILQKIFFEDFCFCPVSTQQLIPNSYVYKLLYTVYSSIISHRASHQFGHQCPAKF